jgi:serine protease Do
MLGLAVGVLLAAGLRECGFLSPGGFGGSGTGGEGMPKMAVQSPVREVPGLLRLEEEYTHLVESVVPSVVSITTQTLIQERVPMVVDAFDLLFGPRHQRVVEHKAQGLGSGVVVSEEGYVLTNEHVVAGMQEIRVQLTDGRIEPAELVGSDVVTDIALLKIKGPVQALPLGDSDRVRVGQPVFAVGNPFGLQETVTQGIVSAKGRAVQDSGVEFLQTDAAVNEGNSGGPLLNVRGEIVGINTAIYSKNKGGGWLGISFAVPSNVAKDAMERILREGRVQRQTLGVATTALKPSMAAQFGLSEAVGALITAVKPGSPAEKAGLRRGDVILGVNGKILADPAGLRRALEGKSPGTKIQLSVVRNGREYTVMTEVAALAEERPGN